MLTQKTRSGKILSGVFSVIILLLIPAVAMSTDVTPSELKAAFLVNILGFLDNPSKAMTRPVICTATSREINNNISQYLVANRLDDKIQLQNVSGSRNIDQCWSLYIESDQVRGSNFLLTEARSKGILTITGEGYTGSESMFMLKLQNRKLCFDANKLILDAAKIKIGSRILTLARKVIK